MTACAARELVRRAKIAIAAPKSGELISIMSHGIASLPGAF
jgi:hypothetical protein